MKIKLPGGCKLRSFTSKLLSHRTRVPPLRKSDRVAVVVGEPEPEAGKGANPRAGVRLCPNHFRPRRTMRPLRGDSGDGYHGVGGKMVIRADTLERWSVAAAERSAQPKLPRRPARKSRSNSRKRRRDRWRAGEYPGGNICHDIQVARTELTRVWTPKDETVYQGLVAEVYADE